MRTILITNENISEYEMRIFDGQYRGQTFSFPVIILEKNINVCMPGIVIRNILNHKSFFWVVECGDNYASTLRSSTYRYTIYRDDHMYPIHGNTIEEIRRARSEGNRSFMSHGYGSIAYDAVSGRNVDIYA